MANNRADRIAAALTDALAPASVHVQDDSKLHAGHAGAAPGGETHYTLLVVSPAFAGKSRVERSRIVHQALTAEFSSGLHALSLVLRTPEEEHSRTARANGD